MDQEILGPKLPRELVRCRRSSTRCTDRHPCDHCSTCTYPAWGSWSRSKSKYWGRNQSGRQDADFRTQISIDTAKRGSPSPADSIERDVDTHGGAGKGTRLLLCQGISSRHIAGTIRSSFSSCGRSRSWYSRNLNRQTEGRPAKEKCSTRSKRFCTQRRSVPLAPTRPITC